MIDGYVDVQWVLVLMGVLWVAISVWAAVVLRVRWHKETSCDCLRACQYCGWMAEAKRLQTELEATQEKAKLWEKAADEEYVTRGRLADKIKELESELEATRQECVESNSHSVTVQQADMMWLVEVLEDAANKMRFEYVSFSERQSVVAHLRAAIKRLTRPGSQYSRVAELQAQLDHAIAELNRVQNLAGDLYGKISALNADVDEARSLAAMFYADLKKSKRNQCGEE